MFAWQHVVFKHLELYAVFWWVICAQVCPRPHHSVFYYGKLIHTFMVPARLL